MNKTQKTRKVLGLFLVASLALSGGCGQKSGPCPDVDHDGICDDEEGGTSSGGIHSSSYSNNATKSGSSGMSSGTKGGIGSSGQVSSS